jgi:hypothetical protein
MLQQRKQTEQEERKERNLAILEKRGAAERETRGVEELNVLRNLHKLSKNP